MNTTLLTVTCLLLGLTIPLASAGIPVGARVGPVEICFEVLGPGVIEEGCVPACFDLIANWCDGDGSSLIADLETDALN